MKIFLSFISYFVFLYPLYMSLVWVIGGLFFYFRREKKQKEYSHLDSYPFFSIVIPAHNEEKHIEETIMNLKQLNYPSYEVIVVNDGSTDNTAEILNKLAKNYTSWLKVIHLTPNSGKAKALNIGILFSKGEYILTIDADCFLDKNALRWIIWHFVKFPRVGAVTGNPRVLNRTTLLAKIQVGEYSSIIGLIKRTQRLLGKVLTVSGVIAAFRKSALYDVGFFDADTVTEDIDVTWKLQKKFWDIRYEPKALCWVLVPETLKGLWKQRLRWAQGGVQVLKKHFDIWFDKRQRRLWPIYIEYLISIIWAYSLVFLFFSWLIAYFLSWKISISVPINPAIPKWTGSVLALACLLQFGVSMFIDAHYEKKFFKYYFWVIWYPFFYWFISSIAIIVAVFNVFISKSGVSITWESPDRGLHTLKKWK